MCVPKGITQPIAWWAATVLQRVCRETVFRKQKRPSRRSQRERSTCWLGYRQPVTTPWGRHMLRCRDIYGVSALAMNDRIHGARLHNMHLAIHVGAFFPLREPVASFEEQGPQREVSPRRPVSLSRCEALSKRTASATPKTFGSVLSLLQCSRARKGTPCKREAAN